MQSSLSPVWAGYRQGDILTISNNMDLYLIDNSGNCLSASNTAMAAFNIRFGLTMKIICKFSSLTVPQLFSVFSGASINQFSVGTDKVITLPTITDGSITDVQINFVIGEYGSSSKQLLIIEAKYIERATTSFSSVSGSTTRSLTLNFVQTSQIGEISSGPSFFPQIPKDMFYPIYLLS